MNSDLGLLLKLQVIDFDCGELERSKQYLPDMMDNLTREMNEAREALENSQTQLEVSRVRQKSLELEVSTKEAELHKFQQQMMAIKTNKEYDALVAEIDMTKGAISEMETELIEIIDSTAQMEKDIEKLNETNSHMQENNTRQLAILQEKVDSIGDKMSGKVKERQELMATIPRQTLTVYERVRKGRGGDAVVVVKKRACGSCYKALTPRKVQELKKADRIHTCESCGRLIFWDEVVSN